MYLFFFEYLRNNKCNLCFLFAYFYASFNWPTSYYGCPEKGQMFAQQITHTYPSIIFNLRFWFGQPSWPLFSSCSILSKTYDLMGFSLSISLLPSHLQLFESASETVTCKKMKSQIRWDWSPRKRQYPNCSPLNKDILRIQCSVFKISNRIRLANNNNLKRNSKLSS